MVIRGERRYLNILRLVVAALILGACQLKQTPAATVEDPPATSSATQELLAVHTIQPVESIEAPQQPVAATARLTVLPSKTPLPQPSLTPSPTPDPYEGLSIASLAERSYGGGEITVEEILAVNSYFTRTLVSYPSDGLRIYGFMNVPKRTAPPYPVVIALHGYIEPEIYRTLDYTTRYADALARAGLLVIHPNLRGYAPSDEGDNLFRVGMAIDVLNLIALVDGQAGLPGALYQAQPGALGIWGHSMGGGISLRVITVNPSVRAAVIYGSMSADDRRNYERIFDYFSNGARGQEELNYPPEAYLAISPIYYLDRVQSQISIHHGDLDPDVPPAWSRELCLQLEQLGKQVECYFYPDEAHTFDGEGDELFMQRAADFFLRVLKP